MELLYKIIRGVELHPCLWDSTAKVYKDEEMEKRAWEEIAVSLIPNFEKMNKSDQTINVEIIQNRWKEAVDHYNKTINSTKQWKDDPNRSQPCVLPYFHCLRFLDKLQDVTIPANCIDSSDDENNTKTKKTHKNLALQSEQIIKEIQKRPVLWDKSNPIYREEIGLKMKEWREVAKLFEPNFEEMDEFEKKKAVSRVQSRWFKMKYDYIKTIDMIRPHVVGPKSIASKVFMTDTFKYLRFLDKLQDFPVPADIDNESLAKITIADKEDHNLVYENNDTVVDVSTSESEDEIDHEINTKYCDDDLLKSQITKMLKTNSKRMDDIDVSFFNSILPMVREMDDFEKLEFRSKVTKALLKYSNK